MRISLRLVVAAACFSALFTACPPPEEEAVCGDGKIGKGEACDDGNTVDGDECSADCKSTGGGGGGFAGGTGGSTGGGTGGSTGGGTGGATGGGTGGSTGGGTGGEGGGTGGEGGGTAGGTGGATGGGTGGSTGGGTGGGPAPVCGNMIPEGDEDCDDGNDTPGDGCENDCTFTVACGNGKREGAEVCDDGNTVGGDGCEAACEAFTDTANVKGGPGINESVLQGEVCHVTPGDGARLITGIILSGDEAGGNAIVYVGGQLLINAAGDITCVGLDCSGATGAAAATKLVCPQAVVSPGLINAHDHIEYQAGPATITSERYEHRHDWRVGNNGHTSISNGGTDSGGLRVRWGALRQVMSGTTSIISSGAAGSSPNPGTNGLLRDLSALPASQLAPTGTNISGTSGVQFDTFPLGDSSGTEITSGCNYASLPTTVPNLPQRSAYFPHIAEGIEQSAHNEFVCLSAANGSGVVTERTGLIHGIGLKAQDIALMGVQGTSLIWSPRSNVALYGDTAAISVYKRLGVNIAMGTDWTRSGSLNMLREVQCADELNAQYFGNALTDEELWRTITSGGADASRTHEKLGRLKVGLLGDVAVFKRKQGVSFFRSIIEAQPQDVVLTLRGGKVLFGDANIISQGGIAQCDTLNVCGTSKAVCLQGDVNVIGSGNNTYASLAASNSTSYPLFFCGAVTNEPTCVPERGPGNSKNGSTVYTASDADTDKDGIPDAEDNCPNVFNPVRPMDNGVQANADGDTEGDACDVCPLNPGTSVCSPFNPLDPDGDGLENDEDNCPNVYNPGQEDSDLDGKGDVCDACPAVPNPGNQGCPATICEVKQGIAPTGTPVSLSNVLVTAVGANGFFVQQSTTECPGPQYSGLFVFGTTADLAAGDVVSIASGTPNNYFGQIQLNSVGSVAGGNITVHSSSNPPPLPVTVPADIHDQLDGGAFAYESVVVRVDNVTVVAHNPDAGPGDSNPTNELVLNSGLYVNDFIYLASPLPLVGTDFVAIQGVLDYRNNRYKLEVRDEYDFISGPPSLAAITPAQSFLYEGSSTPLPGPVRVQLSGFAQGDTGVTVTSASPELEVGDGGLIIVPVGALFADVPLNGLAGTNGANVELTAEYDGVIRTANVRVIGLSEQPVLTSLTPGTALVNAGSTATFTVSVDFPVMTATDINLSLLPNTVGNVPMTVTVDPGQSSVTFDANILPTAQGNDTATLTATLSGSTPLTAAITVNDTVTATELIISEYCEGGVGNNKYVEIFNGTGATVDLGAGGYALRLYTNGAGAPSQTFNMTGTLDHGATLVVCHEAIDSALSPLCDATTPANGGAINFNGDDAVALARNGNNLDIVGVVGTDPGTGWPVCGTANATVDRILIRKSGVTSPTTNWGVSAGTSASDCQWELRSAAAPVANIVANQNMGAHTFP